MYPAVVMGLYFSPFAAYAVGTNILFEGGKNPTWPRLHMLILYWHHDCA